MIQFTESLADAYVRPARNVALPSTPGRQVKFLQGHAVIKDGRDLAAMLRRTDVQIQLTEYSLNWIEDIERAAGQVRADVRRPPPPEPKTQGGWDMRQLPRDPKTGRLIPRKNLLEAEAES